MLDNLLTQYLSGLLIGPKASKYLAKIKQVRGRQGASRLNKTAVVVPDDPAFLGLQTQFLTKTFAIAGAGKLWEVQTMTNLTTFVTGLVSGDNVPVFSSAKLFFNARRATSSDPGTALIVPFILVVRPDGTVTTPTESTSADVRGAIAEAVDVPHTAFLGQEFSLDTKRVLDLNGTKYYTAQQDLDISEILNKLVMKYLDLSSTNHQSNLPVLLTGAAIRMPDDATTVLWHERLQTTHVMQHTPISLV
jgi:hypothetical protein